MPRPRSLFDQARPAATEARRAARRKIEPKLSRLQEQALRAIRALDGLTDEELAQAMQVKLDTARARRCELRDLGLGRDSGRTRRTASDRAATVWVAAVDRPDQTAAGDDRRGAIPREMEAPTSAARAPSASSALTADTAACWRLPRRPCTRPTPDPRSILCRSK